MLLIVMHLSISQSVTCRFTLLICLPLSAGVFGHLDVPVNELVMILVTLITILPHNLFSPCYIVDSFPTL